MLMPKRVKHRKQHRGRMTGQAPRGNKIDFGEFGMMALECGWITSRQIESARIAMTRHIKRGGKVWIRIFPDKSFTKKPLEQRMGKGKAAVEGWVAVIKPGRVMFEMDGVTAEVAREAMRLAMMKLPIDCKFVTKENFEEGKVGVAASKVIMKKKTKLVLEEEARVEAVETARIEAAAEMEAEIAAAKEAPVEAEVKETEE